MPKIRVLNITPTGKIGGRERQLYILTKELVFYSNMVFDLFFIRAEGIYYENTLDIGTRVYEKKYLTLDPRYFFYVYRLFKKYDIIHFWGIDFYTFFVSLIVRKVRVFMLGGTRVLVKKRFYDVVIRIIKKISRAISIRKKAERNMNPNFSNSYVENDIERYSGLNNTLTLIGLYKGILRVVKKSFFISFLKRCSLVIVPSYQLEQFCKDYYGLDSNKISVINNSLNFNDVNVNKSRNEIRKELNLSDNIFIVGTAARYDNRKRLDRLIRAMSLVSQQVSTKAIILGNGNEKVKIALDSLITRLGVNDRIILAGFRTDIYNYVNICDLFVLPSDSEGFGLSIVEAMYLRIPTVVFKDGGGVLEIVHNGKTGYVVKSEKELANLIEKIYLNRNVTKGVVQTGYKYILEKFNVEKAAKSYFYEFLKISKTT